MFKYNCQNANGDIPLHFACRSNNTDVATLLLDKTKDLEGTVPNLQR